MNSKLPSLIIIKNSVKKQIQLDDTFSKNKFF
jgi:hypothetical protein